MSGRDKDWLPGDLIVVLESSLVERYLASDGEEGHFTRGLNIGLIIGQSHRWKEPNELQWESHRYYIVFLNERGSTGFYVVPGSRIVDPSEAKSPGRLFGRSPWLSE